ncbi:MAG: oxidoreductase domain protein [Ramlibacter sp.]|nr:oxidoreductase domain protein [Ramlibacter sp.]
MSATRIGIAGMGAAGLAFIPALRRHPGFDWVAFAEPVDTVREQYAREHGVPAYSSLGGLLTHPGLDAVYIATPTELHTAQVVETARAGKHILVEKPMAVSMEAGRAMVGAAEAAGVMLVVGHSHSHDLPVRRMRELIASGELGAVGMVNTWCYTDWMNRPRRAAELDSELGGGVTFRQGAHQFDILRLLCGGLARSIRARTFDWNPQRRAVGAHSAWIDFENGAAATAIYNGYGGFSTMDLCHDISEWGLRQAPGSRPTRAASTSRSTAEDELLAKRQRAAGAIPGQAPYQPFFGLTVVSCERGDIRQTPAGLAVYTAGAMREIALPAERSPRELVLDEFQEAITGRRRAVHDGRWGLGTLELCIAALQSSRTGAEVRLSEQARANAA